ncbi:hypothetical protein [Aminipila luticellarii]|uniref:Uncharacterized protein n=1 Tax=Aminipila luticellarii TaxID=2507160 RepID=A0A410PWQ0_9FIRM|nr:hypothetical protein [Aminipila luticellarii]QAT43334.1 hypothetical protein EQM06_08960 [Aminipila luticellarii]
MSCNCDCNRLNGIKDLKEGLCNLQQGVKYLCNALDALRCYKICEADNCLLKGICQSEKGLCQCERGLRNLNDDLDRQEIRTIREGICKIRNGIQDICDVWEDLRRQCGCQIEEDLVNGIADIKEGIDRINSVICR